MTDTSGFTATVFQNEFLPEGATEVNAVVTVTASGGDGAPAAASAEKAVLLIVDTSGSMEAPSSKIRAARKAAATACQMIVRVRDGRSECQTAGVTPKRRSNRSVHCEDRAISGSITSA